MPRTEEIDAFLDDPQRQLAREVDDFAAEQIAPLPPPADDAEARQQAREILARLGSAGVLRYTHPLDLRACCLIREALGAASSLADEVFALQALGSTPIAMAGSEELKERWLCRRWSRAARWRPSR